MITLKRNNLQWLHEKLIELRVERRIGGSIAPPSPIRFSYARTIL
jgi:hypothetical protein